MGRTLVVAEKPSVGRDIARVLGCTQRMEGALGGEQWCVTWAIGHLVTIMEPEELDPRWKSWRAEDLPILPPDMKLKVIPKTKQQYGVIRSLMRSEDITDIVCATDAGREGELIFRYIYAMAGCKKPVRRLWISSMTDEAIREGFAGMRPGADYDALYDSARCRAQADWLVGMNASRAFTLRYHALLSVGRVQTPTLQMLVKRRAEIEAFQAKQYWQVQADFGDYTGLWFDPERKAAEGGERGQEKRIDQADQAEAIAARVRGAQATIESATSEEKREIAPQLFDLTTLQREANQILSFTAQRTLSTAQALYEKHKLITYPRTDSRHLPKDMAGKTRKMLEALPEPYAQWAKPLLGSALPMSRRVFDDAKVSDHHAILPTPKRPSLDALSADERKLYDLIARWAVAAFWPPYVYDALRVVTRAGEAGDRFISTGRVVRAMGWKEIYQDLRSEKKRDEEKEEQSLPALQQGDIRRVEAVRVKQESTKPPTPHTDASLLYAMEHAGREVEDEELRERMKDHGLGTPATRAAIIERLMAVGYAQRKGKQILATDKGMQLIAVAPADITSPETTGRWEKGLADIAQHQGDGERFLEGIRRLCEHLVQYAATQAPAVAFAQEERGGKRGAPRATATGARKKSAASAGGEATTPSAAALEIPCPLCGQGRVSENSKAFGCSRWREGCKFTLWKNALQRDGGPALTARIVIQVLGTGAVRGSTGTITWERGQLRFSPASALSHTADTQANKP